VVKAIVVYESKYGNTKLAAESVVEGLNQVSGTEVKLTELNDVDFTRIGESDMVLVGSPNHIGRATRSIRKFIDKLGNINLEGKQAAVFDTYMGGDFEKAVKKMEKQMGEKTPELKIITPDLSVGVDGMKGPITDGQLSKCLEYY